MTKSIHLSRRDALRLTATGAAGLLVPAAVSASLAINPDGVSRGGSLPFHDPIWNRDTFAKIQAETNPDRQKVGWYAGKVIGVRDGEPLRELFGFEGFSVARMLPQNEDGSWRQLLREVGFYRDLRTGRLLDEWENVYTGETVKVVPVANDPFNFTISEYVPQPPDYGGLNPAEAPKIPLILPWTERAGKVLLSADIHLYYPSALQPDEWPRESPGPMSRVSEMFRYVFDPDKLSDGSRTVIPYSGTWARVTPWLPWMLMDRTPGHILYYCDMGTSASLDEIAEDIVARAESMDPKWLEAPTEDYGPSLSSLENYMLTESPAPARDSRDSE